MGLFSRKKSDQATRSTSRSATSSEAQAAELRGRARRRLIGALILVLAAVIVVPMMFDDDISSQQPDTLVVLPSIVPPVTEPDLATVTEPEYSVEQPVLSGEDAMTMAQDEGVVSAGDVAALQPDTDPIGVSEPAEPTPAAPTAQTPEPSEPQRPEPATPRPEPAASTAKPTPEPAPASGDQRTDDGSVALALLEGRTPPSAPAATPAQQGNFILQVAAYSTEADAQARRSSLAEAGVTNAYVEKGVSNDRTTYRLRVGSFPTRDAAQAAQARLRALGYDNSLLLTR